MKFFFFNDTATTEIYTLSLHDALPIYSRRQHLRERHHHVADVGGGENDRPEPIRLCAQVQKVDRRHAQRSEEHTSELQSRQYLVCRLLLEKKKNILSADSIQTI